MLTGGPGADPARGYAEGGDAPVVIGERRANKAPKGEADVGIGGEEASRLRTGRHRATGIQELGPTRTGPEEAEGALRIWKATDGIKEGTCFCHAASKEGLTPVRGSNGCPEELERGRAIPSAAWEATWPKRL